MLSTMLVEELAGKARREARRSKALEESSGYWVHCAACGRKTSRRQMLEKGCWVCGSRGIRGEASPAREVEAIDSTGPEATAIGYKTSCEGCGGQVVTSEYLEKGCYLCGAREAPKRAGEGDKNR